MTGRRRWVVLGLGVLALGLAAWGLLGRAGPSPEACGSYLLPQHSRDSNTDAALGHDIACRSPRAHHAANWAIAALVVGTLAGVLAINCDPPPHLPDEPSW